MEALTRHGLARMLANPEGLRYSTGVVTFAQAFEGFTLAELAVLQPLPQAGRLMARLLLRDTVASGSVVDR